MTTHLIWYGRCDCYVWPIALANSVGRCGRCHEHVEGLVPSKADALAQFRAAHGRSPAPIT